MQSTFSGMVDSTKVRFTSAACPPSESTATRRAKVATNRRSGVRTRTADIVVEAVLSDRDKKTLLSDRRSICIAPSHVVSALRTFHCAQLSNHQQAVHAGNVSNPTASHRKQSASGSTAHRMQGASWLLAGRGWCWIWCAGFGEGGLIDVQVTNFTNNRLLNV